MLKSVERSSDNFLGSFFVFLTPPCCRTRLIRYLLSWQTWWKLVSLRNRLTANSIRYVAGSAVDPIH